MCKSGSWVCFTFTFTKKLISKKHGKQETLLFNYVGYVVELVQNYFRSHHKDPVMNQTEYICLNIAHMFFFSGSFWSQGLRCQRSRDSSCLDDFLEGKWLWHTVDGRKPKQPPGIYQTLRKLVHKWAKLPIHQLNSQPINWLISRISSINSMVTNSLPDKVLLSVNLEVQN